MKIELKKFNKEQEEYNKKIKKRIWRRFLRHKME
jgi:hypothetical protein